MLILSIFFAVVLVFATFLGLVAIAGAIVFGACALWDAFQEIKPPAVPQFRFKSPAEAVAQNIAERPAFDPPTTPATPDEVAMVTLAINPLSKPEYLAGATRRRVMFTANKRRAKVWRRDDAVMLRAWSGMLSKHGHEPFVVFVHRQYSGEMPTEIERTGDQL